jgi:4-amino-4-deoxy-L-arabinose transferase-like glycosyltransferase
LPHPAALIESLPDTRRPRLGLALICLLLWLPGFFTIPPSDRDESRFAQASRQMVETGDYVRIRLGEEERNKKPVGIHWAQAASVHALETLGLGSRADIWAYRLPGLLGALAAVLATFHFGRHLVGRRAAFLGAALLASTMVLVVETHIAKTDAALLGTVAAAMGLFGRAYLTPGGFTARQAAAFWAILGLGILLKGPIAPMVPLLAGITLAIADRQAPWLRPLRAAWGVPLMLGLALPWLIAIGIATEGRFFEQAVGGDMLGKVGAADEKHWGPPGYYLAIFGIAAFPAAFLVIRAVPGLWQDRLQPPVRFLLAWAVPTWLVFEAVATKLPHYTMIAWPALMLLGARWAMDPLRRRPPRWLGWIADAAALLVPLGLALAAILVMRQAESRVITPALLALPFALLLAWRVRVAMRAEAWTRAGLVAVLLAAPLYAVVMEGTLARLQTPFLAPRVAALLGEQAPGLDPAQFGVVGYHEPSLQFAVGGGIRLLRDGPAAALFLSESPGRVVAVGDRDEAAFRRAAAGQGLALRELGAVAGFNYVRGRWLTLNLYRMDR